MAAGARWPLSCRPPTLNPMQDAPRLFVEHSLSPGAILAASGAQAHYLQVVLRRADGSAVRLFNGVNGEWDAALRAGRRDRAEFVVGACVRPQVPEPGAALVFAVLKRDATDLVVRQATELGVSALHPVFTERTNSARINAGRLTLIAREAAEQSERLSVPVLHPVRRLADLLGNWPDGDVLVAAIERAGSEPVRPACDPVRTALLVGPEGGFTGAELDALRARPFVLPATLGPRILRAETAAIVGLALLQARDLR